MKLFVVLFSVISIVYSENCTDTDTTTCASEICADGFVPTCERNICTCNPIPTQPEGGCVTLSDCTSYWINHHCASHHRVCENNSCTCKHGHSG